ncbi:hypothetical protein EDD85DRAFT_786434 [Armillaria nabsnona]|nr:hypothetical protein EDD85DRAFT_786434 [Armillaria nabsnona]
MCMRVKNLNFEGQGLSMQLREVEVTEVRADMFNGRWPKCGIWTSESAMLSKTPQIVGVSPDKSGEIYLEICHPAVRPVIGNEGQFEVGLEHILLGQQEHPTSTSTLPIMTSQHTIMAPMVQNRFAGDLTAPNISMAFHMNSMTPREYAFTFRFIIDSTTGTVTVETPVQAGSPAAVPVTPTQHPPPPSGLLHASTTPNTKHRQDDSQPSEYEHDSNNDDIQIKLETETDSSPAQQLAELSPTQSDLDYEQYWEEQCQKKIGLLKDSIEPQLGMHSSPQLQQLDELSPTQSDPDYEQYWEEQHRKRDNRIKHDDNSNEEVIPDSQEDMYLPYPESLIYLGKRSRTTGANDTATHPGKRI